MLLTRIVLVALGAAFAGLVVWAALTGDFSAAGAFLTRDPWGLVTLADLYLGFVLFALVIFLTEKNKWVAAAFALPLFALGNVVAALWLAFRLVRLMRRP